MLFGALVDALTRLIEEVMRGAQGAAATLQKLQSITRLEEAEPPLGLGTGQTVLDLPAAANPRCAERNTG